MTNGGNRSQSARPKIAAMERGPGPARYNLPTLTGAQAHDTTKKLHPAYSFGTRTGNSIFKKDFGPGPSHALDPAITYRGHEGNPHYSLSSRHKELLPFNTPGPGSYAPEKSKTCYQGEKNTPAYSMGSRTRFRKRDAVPSPNSYSLPILMGPHIPNRASSACYTLSARLRLGGFGTDYANTPGPGKYGRITPEVYQKKSPAYSILGRSFMPGDSTKKPGPGSHSPEKVTATQRSPPKYSMGVRHSEYMCPLIIEVSD